MTATKQALDAAHLIDRLERLARSGERSGGLNPVQWEVLRFLARANRFSRTPAALAAFLASTRGTVSQTLISLEEKGLVSRVRSTHDRRSIELALTGAGRAWLECDPLLELAGDIERSVGASLVVLRASLQAALSAAIRRNEGRPFGICEDCRHFRRGVRSGPSVPHHCALLDQALSDDDSRAICHEQEPLAGGA